MNVNKLGSDGRTRSSASARSRLTSRISPWCTTLVWSTIDIIRVLYLWVCHRDFGPAGILVRADQNPQEAAR